MVVLMMNPSLSHELEMTGRTGTAGRALFLFFSVIRALDLILVAITPFQVFGKIALTQAKAQIALNRNNNFQTFPQAVMVLFR